jgi:hypothetical protein
MAVLTLPVGVGTLLVGNGIRVGVGVGIRVGVGIGNGARVMAGMTLPKTMLLGWSQSTARQKEAAGQKGVAQNLTNRCIAISAARQCCVLHSPTLPCGRGW